MMRSRTLRNGAGAALTLVAILLVALPAEASADGQAIVAAAASMAGKPYCWAGGDTFGPTHVADGAGCGSGVVGFDCTGLAIYALYQGAGITGLPHGAGIGWQQHGVVVPDRSQLQPGDIVFFGGTSLSNFAHAGIYAGNNHMWDAADFGVPVQLHPLWRSGYQGAVRYTGTGPGLPDGAFVSVAGGDHRVYEVVGGAPLYVSDWNNVGGPRPLVAISQGQLDGLRAVPRDGTYVATHPDGRVYVIAGGAPIYVSSWSNVGGPKSAIGIDQWDVDNTADPHAHLNSVPSDGTFVASNPDGRVYEIAGGAPLYVSDWNNVGGPKSAIGIDQWAADNTADPHAHLSGVPADGTLVSTAPDGRVYEIAGGAPLYVSSWAGIGGPRAALAIDRWDVDNTADPHSHLRAVPADGTFVATVADGRVYRFAGGAPLYVSSWDAVGGPLPAVGVDQWDVDNTADWHAHVKRVPSDGTFINTASGHVYRIAGGAPFLVGSWAVFGALQPSVTVDQWAVDHRADPHAHLDPAPADGTMVRGLPSQSYWVFHAGLRDLTLPNSNSVGVDDLGLAAWPQRVAPGRTTTQGTKHNSAKLPTLTASATVRYLPSVLTARFRDAFRHRHGYRRACRQVSRTRVRCTVSWRYRRYYHHGTVIVWYAVSSKGGHRVSFLRIRRTTRGCHHRCRTSVYLSRPPFLAGVRSCVWKPKSHFELHATSVRNMTCRQADRTLRGLHVISLRRVRIRGWRCVVTRPTAFRCARGRRAFRSYYPEIIVQAQRAARSPGTVPDAHLTDAVS